MLTFTRKIMFAILFLLASCMDKQKEVNRKGYEIVGQVKNIPAHRVYMIAMLLDSAGLPKWPVIDSAEYVDETFIFSKDTQLVEPAWATGIFYIDSVTKIKTDLAFDNKFFSNREKPNKQANFILENAQIEIAGDVNEKNGLKLNGAKETDFEFHYGLMQPPYKVFEINKKIDSAPEASNTSLLISYKEQKNKLLTQYKTNFKEIISSHSSYFQALFNTYNNAEYFTTDELQELAKIFDKRLLELPTGKKLIQFIKQGENLEMERVFPGFYYNDTTGRKIALSDVKGANGTLIVFWASWCAPCREEIPELKTFYNQYHSKGITIVSISVDNDFKKWKEALLKEQMPWYNLSNLPGYYSDIYSKYNIKAIPLMFLLNRNNKILLAGNLTIEEFKQRLKLEGITAI